MTFPITLPRLMTSSGARLSSVYLPHEPTDGAKIVEIAQSMAANGWQGRPVILSVSSDHAIALTGSHRLAACANADSAFEITTIELPEDLTAEDWDLIDGAHDDDDLLAAFETIAEGRDDMSEIVAVMRAEVESNQAA